ncbi:hypothetical protein DOTSEDRAFT_38410 [Dothistroma septosporum NZE10]|uniref:Uncharacterized protein n=1 Tax=Dothistroma septosporum (strain NZE10 / CBS 128990) TaxID=675120 RepID=M2Y1J4_DOTSN|nr:hypothetical protein DOTSEDRAFT_38410 [Dothistroma septosporum NZE10]
MSSAFRRGLSLYDQCEAGRILISVGADDVKILRSTDAPKRAIGTRHLNGCSCVVISGNAVLLAHIQPLPGKAQDWAETTLEQRRTSSIAHHNDLLSRVTELLQRHNSEFPASTTTWAILANDPDGTLNDIVQLFRNFLSTKGYELKQAHYEQANVRGFPPKPKGELVVLRGKNEGIYLEHRLLEGAKATAPVPSSSRAIATFSGSSARPKQSLHNDDSDKRNDNSGDENERKGNEVDPDTSTSQDWHGYQVRTTSQGTSALGCNILGRSLELPVSWSRGNALPLVWIQNRWTQTEASAGDRILLVRDLRGSLVRLEKITS